MAGKRRVIWMSDEHWDQLGRVVAQIQTNTHEAGLAQKITPSLVILDSLQRGYFGKAPVSHRMAETSGLSAGHAVFDPVDPRPGTGGSAVFEDPRRFNSRPFTPVPKK